MELHVIENQGEIRYPIGSHIVSAISFVDKALLIIEEKIVFKNANILIWCRGSSGAILAGLLASKLIDLYPTTYTRVIHVKKTGEQAHATDIEHVSLSTAYTNIIIDDFSYTGETIMSIAREMATKEVQYIDLLILSNIHTIWNSETRERTLLAFPVPTALIVGDYNSSYYSTLKGFKPTPLKEIL